MKKIFCGLFILIASMHAHASIDPNWDSAWDQRTEIYLSSNNFENPEIDEEIQALFASTELTRKFIRYELEGEFFYVLLIHNPDKLNLKSEISINTSKHGLINSTFNYNSKVGIFVNKEAPQELIDHLSTLHHLSWWDSWWDLLTSNGSKATIIYEYTTVDWGSYTTHTYKYTPCTVYKAMKYATP